jgi:predicted nucleotide-binding protein
MSKPTKSQALRHLNSLLTEAETQSQKKLAIRDGSYDAWTENAKLAIDRIFGAASAEHFAFDRIYFVTPPYEEKIQQAIGYIKARIADVELYWEDEQPQVASRHISAESAKPKVNRETDEAGTTAGKRPQNNRVFVVCGRDQKLRLGVFSFLRSIGVEPLDFAEARRLTENPNPYIGEILDTAFQEAQAVVVLLTPDDEARLRRGLLKDNDSAYEKDLTGQARPNVLFEAGMALAFHPRRTVLVQFGDVRPFSDVAGRYILHMDNEVANRQEFAQRLEVAGCKVNIRGTDWHKEGELKVTI